MLPRAAQLAQENPNWGWPDLIEALGGTEEYLAYRYGLSRLGLRLGPPKLTDEILRQRLPEILPRVTSVCAVLREFGLKSSNAQNSRVKKIIRELNLSTEHLRPNGDNTGKRIIRNCDKSLESLLVADSHLNNTTGLKKRLIKAGLLRDECYLCGLPPVWKDKPLVLRLDHINGVKHDNRLVNLRMLCPNCDAQTDTYAGKNKALVRRVAREKAVQEARKTTD